MKNNPDKLIEIFSVTLLFLATSASAWSSYQASVWSGDQVQYIGQMSKASADEVRLSAAAGLKQNVDIGTEAIFMRFRPEMKKAVEAWLATRPFENPDAPQGPLAMKEYGYSEAVKAQKQSDFSDNLFEKAKEANIVSTDYIRFNLVLAPLIFIGGVLPRFRYRGVKAFAFLFSFSILFISLFRLFLLPIRH
ncbi:MAG: hypothetical protein ACM3OC_01585 [Deltaproteobacteria bacterium]